MYTNRKTGVTLVAHVDDFLVLGDKRELQSLLKALQVEYECNGEIMGPDRDEVKQLKFLGRTVSLTKEGIEWEGDAKHVEAFLKKMDLAQERADHQSGTTVTITGRGRKARNSVATPGVKRDIEEPDQRTPMSNDESTEYRGLVALLNYMSQDRPDTSFASKEAAKTMSAPAREDMIR